ncbi:uncharacterized protein METZ01_LOCUS205556 [marine metagenome]|uniref:Uncharacterized protein n=1 Tax=marine metagenome TaxID=408172 RepID=A0A382EQT5_9ZZZZ
MLTIKHVGYATKDYALCQQNNLIFFVCLIKTIFLSWFTRNTKNWHIVF